MDKMLGEVTAVGEVEVGDLVWLAGEYRPIRTVEPLHTIEGGVRLTTLDGYSEGFRPSANVIRGWRFLVARRVD